MASLRRSTFVAGSIAAALFPARSRARPLDGDDVDPAMSASQAELRVLLGQGQAQPAADGFFFNGNHYRGTYSLLPDGGVVNRLPLETYLYSVVPLEMSPSWPAAALEAQAICARTYVLQRSNPRRGYDLVPSEADQVYAGTRSEAVPTRTAVDATAGRVLRYNGAFAQIAYSSCCGGHTEASSEAWGGAPLAYLGGVACPYCDASPNYQWTADVPLERVAAAFAGAIGPVNNASIGARDASGRATSIELLTDSGSATIRGSVFRSGLGGRVIKSLRLYQLRVDGDSLHADGGGLGHGVGLCQWGARGYAQRGASGSDIVGFYFPATAIGDA